MSKPSPDYKMYAYYSAGGMAVSLGGIYYVMSTLGDPAYMDETSCNNANNDLSLKPTDGTACHVWDGTRCRKGMVQNLMCVAPGSKLLQFFLFTFVASLLAMCYFFWKASSVPKASSTASAPASATSNALPSRISSESSPESSRSSSVSQSPSSPPPAYGFRTFKFDRYRY